MALHEESVGAGLNEAGAAGDRATVAVIIPTFNHARFLADAIKSVLAQTRPADEIIVVDDGSTDDPAAVVAQFQQVRLIRQENRGLSGARNIGLRSCMTTHVVFLDADDRLLPNALDAGFTCIAARPDCGCVYGGYRFISENGRSIAPDCVNPIDGDAHLAILRRNLIGMCATVLFRRDCLLAVNGFDETFKTCEDYDLYLRIAQRYRIANHSETVAEYRRHGQNVSNDLRKIYLSDRAVLDRHEGRIGSDTTALAVLKERRATMRDEYARWMFGKAGADWQARLGIRKVIWNLTQAAQLSPVLTMRMLLRGLSRRTMKMLPRAIVRRIERIRGRVPIGSVRFGDLRRLSPLSRSFGWDRGTPVDRHYIESFLAQNAGDIHGRVLEIGSNDYTQRLGGTHVERSDILSVEANSDATLVGDLTQPGVLPEAIFDCIVLTQTLQYIFDVRAAVAALYRALKPGGVLLVTAPSVKSQIDGSQWGATWYWWFTAAALRRLLEESFKPEAVTVEAYGNIFTATAFHYGVALEELKPAELAVSDPDFPVIVAARAIRRQES